MRVNEVLPIRTGANWPLVKRNSAGSGYKKRCPVFAQQWFLANPRKSWSMPVSIRDRILLVAHWAKRRMGAFVVCNLNPCFYKRVRSEILFSSEILFQVDCLPSPFVLNSLFFYRNNPLKVHAGHDWIRTRTARIGPSFFSFHRHILRTRFLDRRTLERKGARLQAVYASSLWIIITGVALHL